MHPQLELSAHCYDWRRDERWNLDRFREEIAAIVKAPHLHSDKPAVLYMLGTYLLRGPEPQHADAVKLLDLGRDLYIQNINLPREHMGHIVSNLACAIVLAIGQGIDVGYNYEDAQQLASEVPGYIQCPVTLSYAKHTEAQIYFAKGRHEADPEQKVRLIYKGVADAMLAAITLNPAAMDEVPHIAQIYAINALQLLELSRTVVEQRNPCSTTDCAIAQDARRQAEHVQNLWACVRDETANLEERARNSLLLGDIKWELNRITHDAKYLGEANMHYKSAHRLAKEAANGGLQAIAAGCISDTQKKSGQAA